MSSSDVTDDAAEAPEVDELRDGLVARLRELHPDDVVDSSVLAGRDVWVRVRPESWAAVAETARLVLGARHFSFLSAIDWKPSPFGRYLDAEVDNVVSQKPAKELPEMTWGVTGGATRFQVFCRLTNLKEHWGITIKADCLGTDDEPSIGSLTSVFAGADWHEREAWEMFGIDFVGHPHLRHIYLPTGFEGHPMRKDFPLLARMVKPWPGIVDTEPMPGGDDEPADGDPAEGDAS